MVCVCGGTDINRLMGAAACCVCGLLSGGGGVGVAHLVAGGGLWKELSLFSFIRCLDLL